MSRRYEARLNRQSSPVRVTAIPIATVLIGSSLPLLPVIASAPVLPPMGLIFLIAWRLLRPEIWPVWAGAFFGLFDDLMSGEPIGTAVLLWSLVFIATDVADRRFLWRNYWQDWSIAALCLITAIVGGLIINGILVRQGVINFMVIVPQLILSVSLFPFVQRLVARLDQWRTMR